MALRVTSMMLYHLGSICAVFSSPVFDPPSGEDRGLIYPNSGWLSSLPTTELQATQGEIDHIL